MFAEELARTGHAVSVDEFIDRFRTPDGGWNLQGLDIPLSTYLSESVKQGFDTTPIVSAAIQEAEVEERERASGEYDYFSANWDALAGERPVNPHVMTEEQWKASEWYREKINFGAYKDVMTPSRAQVMAEKYDERRFREQVLSVGDTNVGRTALGFGAMMLGGLPDPINLIPFGTGAKTARTAALAAGAVGESAVKYGVLEGIKSGAIAGTLGGAAASAITFPRLSDEGEDLSFADFLLTTSMSGVLGGILGGVGGLFSGLSARQTIADRLAQFSETEGLRNDLVTRMYEAYAPLHPDADPAVMRQEMAAAASLFDARARTWFAQDVVNRTPEQYYRENSPDFLSHWFAPFEESVDNDFLSRFDTGRPADFETLDDFLSRADVVREGFQPVDDFLSRSGVTGEENRGVVNDLYSGERTGTGGAEGERTSTAAEGSGERPTAEGGERPSAGERPFEEGGEATAEGEGTATDRPTTEEKPRRGVVLKKSGITLGRLHQETGAGVKQGSVDFMDDGRAVISFFEASDFSTAPHEIFHVFRREFERTSQIGTVQEKADWKTMCDFVGAKEGDVWSAAQEEKFVDAGLKYLAEGKSPSLELASVFEKMKNWFINLYRSLTGTNVDISPEMKNVFDRMLAPQWGRDEYAKILRMGLRVESKRDLMRAMELALQDFANGRPVNVTPILRDSAAVREAQELLSRYTQTETPQAGETTTESPIITEPTRPTETSQAETTQAETPQAGETTQTEPMPEARQAESETSQVMSEAQQPETETTQTSTHAENIEETMQSYEQRMREALSRLGANQADNVDAQAERTLFEEISAQIEEMRSQNHLSEEELRELQRNRSNTERAAQAEERGYEAMECLFNAGAAGK